MGVSNIQLIPIKEMNPGDAARIRNSVISQLVSMAAKELNMAEELLVVRDIEPYTDLGWDYSNASNSTTESWVHSATGATLGYHSFTGSTTMGDQRFVAVFGVRDNRFNQGGTGGVDATTQGIYKPILPISLIKFEVGGAIKCIWDLTSLKAYIDNPVAFSYSCVVIPQNVVFNIYYYTTYYNSVGTPASDGDMYLELIGVTVEPRGKVVSP